MKNFDLVYTGRHILCVVLLLCGLCATARADENPEDPDAAPGRQLPDRTVTGTVTDVQGNPLVGATIVVKDAPTVSGTISGPDGSFSLTVPARSTLLISYVGYKNLRMPVLNRPKLDIVLEEDAERLDNVVVVGYGTQEKSDLTGSIASIKASDIKNIPARSVAEALQGKVAGVMVTKTSGKPGASSDIVIRGVGSINGLNPLFVIDGVACDNNSGYNLNDIESIEVIKDASAAAIYGSRAAGGVVLITTKRGSYNAKPKLSFTSHVGVRQYTDMYRMLGTEDYIRVTLDTENYRAKREEALRRLANRMANRAVKTGRKVVMEPMNPYERRENGIQMNNYWERISARLNVDYQVARSVTVGTRIYLARLRGNPYTESFPWVSIPYMSVYDEDGDFSAIPAGIDFSGANPVADIAYHHQKQSDLMVNGDLFIDELVRYSGMYAADKLDAASSLFGDTEELRPQRPQVPPFTGEENSLNLLQEEKQYVGMYISAHPLEQHRFEIENFTNCQLTNLQPLIDELEQAHKTAKASIAGIVADVKSMNSKNGTPGAKVVLEDFSGNYEFVLFGSDYQRYMPFLQLHNQIFIDGEIGERYFLKPEDRAAGKKSPYGFKIKNISLLGTLCETRLGGLDLQLDTRLIDADFRKKLLKLLQSNKGKLPLNIHLIDIETGYKLDFFSKKFKVDVSQEFLNRLSDLGFKYQLLRKN